MISNFYQIHGRTAAAKHLTAPLFFVFLALSFSFSLSSLQGEGEDGSQEKLEIASQPARYFFRSHRDTEEIGRLSPGEDFLKAVEGRMGSLRLFDRSQNEIPFVVKNSLDLFPEQGRPGIYDTELLEYGLVTDGEESRARMVLKIKENVQAIDQLSFEFSGKDFYRRAVVEAYDGKGWKTIATGAVFDFRSRVPLQKSSISIPIPFVLPGEADDRKLRITLVSKNSLSSEIKRLSIQYGEIELSVDPMETDFRIDRVLVHSPGSDTGVFESSMNLSELQITDDQENKITWIELPEMPVASHKILLNAKDDFFYRKLEIQSITENNSKPVYSSLYLQDPTIKRFPGQKNIPEASVKLQAGLKYRIGIHNKENTALSIQSVRLVYYKPQIFFPDQCQEGCSLYGGSHVLDKKEFDFKKIIDHSETDLLQIPESSGSFTRNAFYNPDRNKPVQSTTSFFERWILQGLILFIALLLIVWIYRMFSSSRGSQQSS